jgi:hypothetical protein
MDRCTAEVVHEDKLLLILSRDFACSAKKTRL